MLYTLAFQYCNTHTRAHTTQTENANRYSGVYTATVALQGLGAKHWHTWQKLSCVKWGHQTSSYAELQEHCSLAKAWLYSEIRNRVGKSANPSCAAHLLLASFSLCAEDPACVWRKPMWVYTFNGELAALTTVIRCPAMSRPQHSRREYTWHSKPLSITMGL